MTDQISFTILLFSKEKDIEIHWKKDMESQLYFLCVYLIHRYPCWLNSTSLKKKKDTLDDFYWVGKAVSFLDLFILF